MAAATAEYESALPRRSFPDEIESEILLWLPVKTLIRFKCACKAWYSLISSPQFQKDHFRRAQTKPPLLLTLHYEKPETDRDVGKGIAPFLHEAVHFLPNVSFYGVKDTDCISVLDIDTEEFRRTIPLPDFYYSLGDCQGHGILITKEFLRLSTLGDSLCLTFDFGELRCRLELWLLKDYINVEWVKVYSIDVSPVYPYPSYGFWTYPTDNSLDKSILLNCSTQEGVKLLGYDPKDEFVTLKKDKEWAAAFYTEAFYSLKSR